MNIKYSKWFACGVLGLMIAFGLGSCSDDHYDINSTNASGTLYENLVATHECDSFVMILNKSYVNMKSYGTSSGLTYGQLLQGTKALTVWAPKDGSYNAQQWLNMLDSAALLLQSGNRVEAAEMYQTVEKRFSQNHLSYFNYTGSYPETKHITLANGKYATYDVTANTISGVEITSDAATRNVASINGTLHVLDSYLPYSYDLREIIEVTPELSNMYAYVQTMDTLEFDERSSTAGAVVNGEVQYVDSVFNERNKVLPNISSNADSLSAAIYLTNNAWNTAIEKIKTFYHFKPVYAYKDENQNLYADSINADSLQTATAIKQLFDNTYYSLYEQPGFNVDGASVATVKNFFETADSLSSTENYSNYRHHMHAPYCQQISDHQTPIEASNGYAFIVDNFNFVANKAWQYDLTYEQEGGNNVNTQYSRSLSTSSPRGVNHTVTAANRNDSVIGVVSGSGYQEFVPSSSAANPQVSFNLANVLSGHYDIYVVIVPENMTDVYNTSPKANKFTATLTYDYDESGNQLTEASTLGTEANGAFRSDVSKVDTILLFQDYKFETSFSGIRNSQPMLTITSALRLADRRTCTPNLNIDCILLVAKDE